MTKRIMTVILAGILLLSAGCSATVSVDPDTGVVSVEGIPINEIMKGIDPDVLSTAPGTDEADEDTGKEDTDDEVIEYEGGLRIAYPEEFLNTAGIYDVTSGEMDDGVFVTEFYYTGVTEEWLEEAFSVPEPSEEDVDKLLDSKVVLTYVFSIDGNRGADDLLAILNDSLNENEVDDSVTAEDIKEITKTEDCTFFRVNTFDGYDAEKLDEDFFEEFLVLYGCLDEILENAEYFKPVDPYEEIVGKKIEFTTTDLDGNEINSEELFAQHKVTMVNVWATWCHWCVEELPELNEINDRLAKKDCAIVGIAGDALDEDTIADAKKLLKENGVEYLNLLPWEGALEDDLPMDSWPTSFFLDSEGTIICAPVIGADVEAYEKIIDEILAGNEPEVDGDDQSPVNENDVNQYRIYVSDTDGNLVEGVMIQLCDDSTCRVENTDASGLAVFKVDKAKYTVHVLKQPKGYKPDKEEYEMPDTYSDLHIVLEKE
ncbi:MAG: TlpA family protein disulfide reductase [Lachnospiraceae bacterium]|nr:TlpA family protein disulfide reductase [Lachnospiraceae bacterium]